MLCGPQGRSGRVCSGDNLFPLPEFEFRPVQPAASCYIGYTLPARGSSQILYSSFYQWITITIYIELFLNDKRVIEGKIKGGIEVTGRRGRRRRKLLNDLNERRGYSHLKKETLYRTMWRARFGRGFGPVVRQTTK